MPNPPQIIPRVLTFNFAPMVNAATGLPDVLDISLIPLGSSPDPQAGATFAGGVATTQLELSNPVNSWPVNLVPSNDPGLLSPPLNYRVLWRTGVLGPLVTYDFAMPDADLTFDALLAGTSNIINGSVYLQQTDLGVPGRVARLDSSGNVITSAGVICATETDIATLTTSLGTETTARQSAVSGLNTSLQTLISNQAASTLASAESFTTSQVSGFTTNLNGETGARQNADAALQTQITTNATSIGANTADITAINTTLGTKADLVGGLLKVAQIPPQALDTAVAVANQTAMLALNTLQVQPGDLAVRPDGVFILIGADPSQLANWMALTVVSSVNGKRGAAVLTAADVGAIATGASITQSQVTGLATTLTTKADLSGGVLVTSQIPTGIPQANVSGLTTALTAKANQTDMTAAQAAITALQTDPSTVHTSPTATPANTIPSTLLDANMVYLNGSNQLTKKDGTVLAGSGIITGVNGHTGPSVTLTAADVGAIATGASITQAQVTGLSTALSAKANQTDMTTAQTNIATNTTNIAANTTALTTKALQTDMTTAQANIAANTTALTTKADLVAGVLATAQIPTNIPQASVTGLSTTLAAKADLSGGVLATAQIPTGIPQASVSGLSTTLTAKADLVSGKLSVAQIPPEALLTVQQVTSQAAMLALTSTQVQPGDFCIITTGANIGTYILTGTDPSMLANWVQLPGSGGGGGTITSVNGHTGPSVTVTAADVGAIATGAAIPISEITGLATQLATLATTTALTSGLATKTAFSDVQGMLTSSSLTKRADYVATSAIASLAGLQSIDGVVTPTGALVLATAQSSSINNGLWVASAGSWTRPTADYATGAYVAQDTLILVANQTAGANGTANNATIWQMQATSGTIDTSATTWTRIGYIAAPFTPVAGNGISLAGSTFSAHVASGGGLLSPSGGLQRDPNIVPGKATGTVPSGSPVAGITHNLNTTSPIVSIWDTGSNTLVLAGITVTGANSISIEFASAPATGQYRYCVVG